jgi:hypothetical protein
VKSKPLPRENLVDAAFGGQYHEGAPCEGLDDFTGFVEQREPNEWFLDGRSARRA